MRVYLELAKKSFLNSTIYRADCVAGIINAIVMIFVNIAIWRAIYEEEEALEGVQFKIIVTYIVLSFLMQLIYTMDEYFIEQKVRSGLISTDFLKPFNFKNYVISYNLGATVFKIIVQFVPTLLISIVIFNMLPPFSALMFFYFIVSAVLGYLVLYQLNFLVWTSSFWFYWTFSLVTIKEALVMILSGALIPLWFMPQWLMDIVELTPFSSIYYTPIQIYLGMIPKDEIWLSMLRQAAWAVILYAIGYVLWKLATKKLVVHGG